MLHRLPFHRSAMEILVYWLFEPLPTAKQEAAPGHETLLRLLGGRKTTIAGVCCRAQAEPFQRATSGRY